MNILTISRHRWPGPQRPSEGTHVLVWHTEGVDRGALYGDVWRLADYGEDQLQGVTGWAEMPSEEGV